MKNRQSLGRGLDALLSPKNVSDSPADGTDTPRELALDRLEPGRFQPREDINDESIAELAASIRQQGVLQPIIVRSIPSPSSEAKRYEIVAGERRWRAAKVAGISQVPVILRELDDQSALAIAIVENLQREDLNPIEESTALLRLVNEFELTHQQVADKVGRSRSAVSNLLRLQELHPDVREALAAGQIDMGHARALLALETAEQPVLSANIVAKGLSVRQVERAVRAWQSGKMPTRASAVPIDTQARWLQEALSEEIAQPVEIRPLKNGKHKLAIEFGDLKQLEAMLMRVQRLLQTVSETAGPRVSQADE